ncbi:MAG: DUF4398 domain-containing protein [Nevskia sp.]|nr:DUF4398 domain-containing protein [Nevskia sp.]
MVNARYGLRLAAAGACALCGCASTPAPPEAAVRDAAAVISRAEDARSADFAAPEMRSAHEKLEAARELSMRAAQDKNPKEAEQARWLAEEAGADAELAAAKAQDIRMRSAERELQRGYGAPAQPAGTHP